MSQSYKTCDLGYAEFKIFFLILFATFQGIQNKNLENSLFYIFYKLLSL